MASSSSLNPFAPLYIPTSSIPSLVTNHRYLPLLVPPPPVCYPFQSFNNYSCNPNSSPWVPTYHHPCTYPFFAHRGVILHGYSGESTHCPVQGFKKLEEPAIVIKEAAETRGATNSTETTESKRPNSFRKRYKKIRARSGTDDMEFFRFQEELNQGCRTTLMIRNIPNRLNMKKVLELLDEHCRNVNEKLQADEGGDSTPSEFDFLYLPMDFRTGCNYGYAFVNFTAPRAACRLFSELQGKSWRDVGSPKVCQVTYARIQGVGELLEHFRNSVFVCENGEYRPVHFTPSRNGLRSTAKQFIGYHIHKPKKDFN